MTEINYTCSLGSRCQSSQIFRAVRILNASFITKLNI